MRLGTPALAALLALAGCGREDGRNMSVGEVADELRDVRVEPGLWEVRSQVVHATGPNMPRAVQARMMAHRRAVRTCVTPAQAAHPERNFLRARPGDRCTYRGFSMREGRMSGDMRCTGGGLPGAMETRMEGRYGPRSYAVTMRMAATGMPAGANVTIETRTIGRRIGDCPPAAPQPAKGGKS